MKSSVFKALAQKFGSRMKKPSLSGNSEKKGGQDPSDMKDPAPLFFDENQQRISDENVNLSSRANLKNLRMVLEVRNRDEYHKALSEARRHHPQLEGQIAQIGKSRDKWYLSGFCDVCQNGGYFLLDWLYSDGSLPNYRERLVCEKCNLNNRQRFAMARLRQLVDKSPERRLRVYLYEMVTPFFSYATQHLQADVIGSEYLGLDTASGQVVDGVRHEDAMDLSFPDQSLNVILSNDVLEHLPDYRKALQEAWRVLAPGGCFLFSIPFYSERAEIVQRAKICSGHIEHLMPEQYHSNPVSERGSLVFYDFGWDILKHCRGAGFSDAHAVFYYSLPNAYLGDAGQLLFEAFK